MSDMLSIIPDTHFLESIRADRGSYWALLAEGIDNSFDADAHEIALTLTKDQIALEDDGVGITKEREDAIVKLGKHGAMPTTKLGMFGIGLKYHAVSAANTLEVDSVSVDGRMKLKADWQNVVRNGRWEIPRPTWTTTLRSVPTGTRVYIRSFRWLSPTAKDISEARDQLAQIFYPALVAQNRITLNGELLPVLHEPEMIHVVEGDVRLPSGKGAHVRGGIMTHPGRLYHVQVSYKHRVIMPKSTFGCGAYSGLRKLFARVDLTGAWTLARFKNAIADNESEELQDAVEQILRPVLEECHSAQMSVTVDEMTALLNDMLPPELIPARPPRKKRKDEPVSEEKRARRQHRITKDGDETPKGPARKRRANEELMITFEQPLVEEYGYGHFVPGRPGRIILAQDCSHISELLEMRDKSIAAQTLYALAIMIWLNWRATQPGMQQELQLQGPFGLHAWTLTKKQKIDNESAA